VRGNSDDDWFICLTSIDMSIIGIGTLFTDYSKWFVTVKLVAENAKDMGKIVLFNGEK